MSEIDGTRRLYLIRVKKIDVGKWEDSKPYRWWVAVGKAGWVEGKPYEEKPVILRRWREKFGDYDSLAVVRGQLSPAAAKVMAMRLQMGGLL
jgi:hypothetical protein